MINLLACLGIFVACAVPMRSYRGASDSTRSVVVALDLDDQA